MGVKKLILILSYKVKHSHDIGDFLDSYRYLLQWAIDVIWNNIEWRRRGKRLIPVIPKSREFRRGLRNNLLQGWGYASHYMDSAIKTAYSILNSWRRNYMKGRRGRSKRIVKKRFVRVKKTLYRLKAWRIRVTLKPLELNLDFDLSNAWFKRRFEGRNLDESILKESELIATFKRLVEDKPKKIAWDMNLLSISIDSFWDEDWNRADLKPPTPST